MSSASENMEAGLDALEEALQHLDAVFTIVSTQVKCADRQVWSHRRQLCWGTVHTPPWTLEYQWDRRELFPPRVSDHEEELFEVRMHLLRDMYGMVLGIEQEARVLRLESESKMKARDVERAAFELINKMADGRRHLFFPY